MLAAALPAAIAGVVVLGSISGFIYWRHLVGTKRRLAGLRMLESEGATAGYSRGSLQQFNPGLGRHAATGVSSGLISTRFLSPAVFAPASAGTTASAGTPANVTVVPSTHFMSVAQALRALNEVPQPPKPQRRRTARVSRDAPARAADSLDGFESSDDSDVESRLSGSSGESDDAAASNATTLFRL